VHNAATRTINCILDDENSTLRSCYVTAISLPFSFPFIFLVFSHHFSAFLYRHTILSPFHSHSLAIKVSALSLKINQWKIMVFVILLSIENNEFMHPIYVGVCLGAFCWSFVAVL